MTATRRRDQIAHSHDPATGCCSVVSPPGNLAIESRDEVLIDYPVIRIVHADPRIWIRGQVLHEIARASGSHPSVTLDDDVLRIAAENQTVVYRLTHYCPPHDMWTAEWPD